MHAGQELGSEPLIIYKKGKQILEAAKKNKTATNACIIVKLCNARSWTKKTGLSLTEPVGH